MTDNLRAAIPRPLHNRINSGTIEQLGKRNPRNRRITRQWNHRIAVSAQHKSRHIFNRNIERLGNKKAKTRRIKNTGHPNHAMWWKAGFLQRHIRHHIERIRDHDNNSLRSDIPHPFGNRTDNIGIGRLQIIATHTGLARNPSGNHHEITSRKRAGVIGANQAGIKTLDRCRFRHIETLALRNTLSHIEKHNLAGQFSFGNALCRSRPHIASTNNPNFVHLTPLASYA